MSKFLDTSFFITFKLLKGLFIDKYILENVLVLLSIFCEESRAVIDIEPTP